MADVAAKRAIVEHHASPEAGHDYDPLAPCTTLRHLASIYAKHPDDDEAWRS